MNIQTPALSAARADPWQALKAIGILRSTSLAAITRILLAQNRMLHRDCPNDALSESQIEAVARDLHIDRVVPDWVLQACVNTVKA